MELQITVLMKLTVIQLRRQLPVMLNVSGAFLLFVLPIVQLVMRMTPTQLPQAVALLQVPISRLGMDAQDNLLFPDCQSPHLPGHLFIPGQ
jgi:hypothetical protein